MHPIIKDHLKAELDLAVFSAFLEKKGMDIEQYLDFISNIKSEEELEELREEYLDLYNEMKQSLKAEISRKANIKEE